MGNFSHLTNFRISIRTFNRIIVKACSILVFGPISLMERLIGRTTIRFIGITYPDRIGHLAIEPDCYLKELKIGQKPVPLLPILYMSPSVRPVANTHLLTYLRERLAVISHPTLVVLLHTFLRIIKDLQVDCAEYAQTWHTSSAGSINKAWGDRPPLWKLTTQDTARGEAELRQLGVPNGTWFVCVHCREPGYCPQENSSDFRNVEIDDYMLAMQAIVDRGGWCIRLGDPSMKPIAAKEGIIDYCHSELRSDWMDVFLCASSKFFLGCCSGLSHVSTIFGVPAATANAAPMCMVPILRSGDISIPKLYWSNSEGRMLTFAEVMGSPMSSFRFSYLFEEAGITMVDNDPADVRDLAIEMLEITEGKVEYTEEDELLQSKFLSLMRPGHYMYGSAARVGRNFLRKYLELLS